MLTLCSHSPQTKGPLAITDGLQAKKKESLPQGLQGDVFLSFLLTELAELVSEEVGLWSLTRLQGEVF